MSPHDPSCQGPAFQSAIQITGVIQAAGAVQNTGASQTTGAAQPGKILDGMTHEQRIFHHSYKTKNKEPTFLTFGALHRQNALHLQHELAKIDAKAEEKMAVEGIKEFPKRSDLLHRYTNAIRDIQFMSELVPLAHYEAGVTRSDLNLSFPEIRNMPYDLEGCARFKDPPFLPTDPVRDLLKKTLNKNLTYTEREIGRRFDDYLKAIPPVEVCPFVDNLARFIIAFIFGLALFTLMLIMLFPHVTLVKSLVTVVVGFLAFASVWSVWVKASDTDTMIATASFAAIMIGFVAVTKPG